MMIAILVAYASIGAIPGAAAWWRRLVRFYGPEWLNLCECANTYQLVHREMRDARTQIALVHVFGAGLWYFLMLALFWPGSALIMAAKRTARRQELRAAAEVERRKLLREAGIEP